MLLAVGAEALVRGAARLAAALGISSLVIGLTVVAFGTSSPELVVSVSSALSGRPDLALGNVVGSNILNVLFILGASAAITPLVVAQQLVRVEVLLMIGVSAVTLLLARDGTIGRAEGAALFAGLVAYVVYAVRASRRESAAVRAEYEQEFGAPPRRGARAIALDVALIAGGLGLLVLGANWLLEGAVALARSLGLSELVIGLTVVALGTSLPEVATSLLAALRGERDIAVGNVVGSNLFNLLGVLGIASAVAPGGVPVPATARALDLPVMLVVALACLPIFGSGHVIRRWEGFFLLGGYAAYTTYLALAASQHQALPAFTAGLQLFVLPLATVTLLALGWTAWRERRTARRD